MANDKKISNIKHLRQIVNAFVKHGLGDLVKLTGLDTYISVGKRILLRASEEQVRYTNASQPQSGNTHFKL